MSDLHLLITNMMRNPTRTVLTFLSLATAFLMFMLLRAIAGAFAGDVAAISGIQRLHVDSRYSMIDNLPVAHVNAIADMPGVRSVTPMVWFGGYYQLPENDFPKLVIDAQRIFEVYPEIIVDQATRERFLASRTAVIAHESVAREFGWRTGDAIPLIADIWPREDGSWNWRFEFAGTYSSDPGSGAQRAMLIRYSYFTEAAAVWIQNQIGSAIVLLAGGVNPKTVAEVVDGYFENSTNPTRSLSEDEYSRQFARQLGDIGAITTLILIAVFFTIVLLTANVASLSFTERVAELAVMKTLGFGDTRISVQVLTEAVLHCLLGAAAGVLVGFALEAGLHANLDSVLGAFDMTAAHAAQAMAIALVLGLVIGIQPALAARRLSIVDALREGG
ncbi:MAG: ABC transporter permease [Pseudomonadales bacterium]|nr:ABC transporter permease [Pseudomonadales bacterium]MDP6469790.1 ABC transporter permease [Pseudomonadales bacterium]MDP6827607.1 ABC transporter permease [Pseudomonadales bacterium]MDP6972434.1 ABC transporter permease [Pseudomonadales bacterium]